MPYIPFFRNWFEDQFGDLCYMHDFKYKYALGKLEADVALSNQIRKRGHPILCVLTFLAVNLPWVWVEYLYKKYKNNERNRCNNVKE